MARNYLPNVNLEMVTNGDPLNLERLKNLFNNGLNKILISVYDGKEDAQKFEDLCEKANLIKDQFIVRHRYLSEDEDFGITLSNRSGLMENAEFKIKKLKESLKKPCYIPSYPSCCRQRVAPAEHIGGFLRDHDDRRIGRARDQVRHH